MARPKPPQSNRRSAKPYARELPIYPSPVTPAADDRHHQPMRPEVLRELERQVSVPPGDLQIVGMDDHIAFRCARSGACCQGRHGLANIVMPSSAAAMYAALHAAGEVQRGDDFVPDILARLVVASPQRRRDEGTFQRVAPRDGYATPDSTFMGLMLTMLPDAGMPDGDRCVFLAGTAPGAFACRWHGTPAQPTQCALAPVMVLSDPAHAGPAGHEIYAIPRSRYRWCQGTRDAIGIVSDQPTARPGFTLRELLERNNGEARLVEARAVAEAQRATEGWLRGFRNHHSPLARLYVDACPALERPLIGY